MSSRLGEGTVGSILGYSNQEIIGDGVWKLPFLATLRATWPAATITWATAKDTVYTRGLKPLADALGVEAIPNCDAQLRFPAVALHRPFAGRRFDLILDTQSHVARTIALRQTRHGAFITPSADYWLSDARPATGVQPPGLVLDRLVGLASLAAGRTLERAPIPALGPEWAATARELLPEGPAYVGLAAGAGGKSKCWPLENYVALAQRIAARGLVPVWLLGPDEADWVEPLKAKVPQARMPEWERTDARRDLKGPCLAIALSARLKAGVANNAGPAQIMAAGGVPVVALHETHSHAEKFLPFSAGSVAVVAQDFGPGIAAIPVDAAEKALMDVLS